MGPSLSSSMDVPTRSSSEQPAQAVRLSVIVPVYNRSDQLRQLLAALAQQSFARAWFEVIICDDGSSEDLSRVASETAGLQIVYLRQERQGAGKARNLGLAHARGEILAFTDSDCLPGADWLRALDQAMEGPSIGLVGGRIDYRGAQFLLGRCLNFLMSSTLGAAGARDPRGVVHMGFYPRAGNLAVRRSLALAVNGFPGSRHGEDLEFSHRIREQGVEIRFVPEAVVVHNERRGFGQMAREAFWKGWARVRLARLFRMHEFLHALPAGFVLYCLVAPLLGMLQPSLSFWGVLPALSYALMLAILAVQGAWALRDIRAAVVVPVCALAIHFGYGVGYLAAWLRTGGQVSRSWHLDRRVWIDRG
jgi:glycosyltransferase involved in cell wall biosynthesis